MELFHRFGRRNLLPKNSGQSISVRLSGLLICSKKYRRLRAIAASRICCEVV